MALTTVLVLAILGAVTGMFYFGFNTGKGTTVLNPGARFLLFFTVAFDRLG